MNRLLVGVVSALFALPLGLQGQACIGSHAPRASFAIGAGASFTDGATSYGGLMGGNVNGPAFLSAGYSRTDFDGLSEDMNTLSGRLGLEGLTGGEVSLCLVAAGGYSWFDVEGVDADGFTIEGGPAIGYSAPIGEEGIFVTPHLQAGVTHTDASASALGVTVEDSRTDGFVAGGVAFGSESLWLRGTVTQVTADGADPVFGVDLGVAFR